MIKLDSITMQDLLPPNLKEDPDAIAASSAITPEFWGLVEKIPKALVFSNIDHLDEQWLDALAIDMNPVYYDTALPIDKKKQLIRYNITLHQLKGTPWAVEQLISVIFENGQVEEWFDYGGSPYAFRVTSSNQFATPEDARKFRNALDSVKNSRSWLEDILIVRTWGDVLNRDFFTWGNVLGLHDWQNVESMLWDDVQSKTWGQLLGDNTWGNIYSFIWEEQ